MYRELEQDSGVFISLNHKKLLFSYISEVSAISDSSN